MRVDEIDLQGRGGIAILCESQVFRELDVASTVGARSSVGVVFVSRKNRFDQCCGMQWRRALNYKGDSSGNLANRA